MGLSQKECFTQASAKGLTIFSTTLTKENFVWYGYPTLRDISFFTAVGTGNPKKEICTQGVRISGL